MLTIKKITKKYGGPICRACIKAEYNVALERRDCKYMRHSDTCPCCGERKHIVKGLKFSGFMKGLKAKDKPAES